MPRTRREIQVFSVSFLDLLSCALGGILVLWFLSMDTSHKQAESYARQIDSMDSQIRTAQAALSAAQQAATDARAQADAQQKAIKGLKDAQGALIGLNGKMEGVVFIFDTSGSMKETGRFDEYKDLLKGWIKHVDFKRFNVIRFSDTTEIWKTGQLADKNKTNEDGACLFVDGFRPDGATSTFAALKAAFSLNPDTITLMSDGRPEPGGTAEMTAIHAWLQQVNSSRQVVINCVAMGNYFGKDYAEFLQKIAQDHGGMFIGR